MTDKYSEFLSKFKSVYDFDSETDTRENGCWKCGIASLLENRLDDSNKKFGKVGMSGMFDKLHDGSTSILFIGTNASYRRFDDQRRAFTPMNIEEKSLGAMFFKALVDAGFDDNSYSIFITNIIKCTTPDNRGPFTTEAMNCSDNLRKDIQLVSPKVVIPLGYLAAQFLGSLLTETDKLKIGLIIEARHPAFYYRNKSIGYQSLVFELSTILGRIDLGRWNERI